jgi:hypothetical protein
LKRAAAGEPRTIPIPERLLDELIAASWIPAGEGVSDATSSAGARAGDLVAGLTPQEQPRDVARSLEKKLYERLYAETGGDFERMAETLLRGDAGENARRVQLRFNQLGLRVRT